MMTKSNVDDCARTYSAYTGGTTGSAATSAIQQAIKRAAFKWPFWLHQPPNTQRNTVRLRANPIQRMWYATMAPQVVTYNEKLPWMSGRWNNRGEGKRGEKNEPAKGGGEKKHTHTGAQAMVLSKCKRRIRERKKMRFVVSCYFQDACVVVVFFKYAHSSAAVLTRPKPRADCCRAACARRRETLKPERRWCHGPDVKKGKVASGAHTIPSPSLLTEQASRVTCARHAHRTEQTGYREGVMTRNLFGEMTNNLLRTSKTSKTTGGGRNIKGPACNIYRDLLKRNRKYTCI